MKSGRDGLLDGAKRAAWFCALAGCLALPHGIVRQALASAAGILFEAAPLLFGIGMLRGRGRHGHHARRAAAVLGCGCGGAAGPAALSFPAAVLCWMTFGPAPAVARFCAAVVIDRVHRRDGACGNAHAGARIDPLLEIGAIARPAFALGLAVAILQSVPATFARGNVPPALLDVFEGLAGVVAGSIAPCATAAVAYAAMARTSAPFAAIGILATAGLVPKLASRAAASSGRDFDGRPGIALLACACAVLAAKGGSGLVHPRLIPLLWFGSAAALVALKSQPRTADRNSIAAPAAMLAALILGSPVPTPATITANWDGVYAGERAVFTGTAVRVDGKLSLVRYAITCCRADASAVVVPTDVAANLPLGAWATVRGIVRNNGTELFLHATDFRAIATPADVYLYR